MSKKTKIWLIIAASLVLIGCIIMGGVMAMIRWDFKKLATGKYETNRHEINEEFCNISMNTDTADIMLALSDDETCRVECYEEKKAKHSVTVQENTLVIQVMNEKSWYDYIGIHLGSPKITVYLPKAEYTSLFIKEDTGDIQIPKDFKFERTDLSLSTGDVKFFASASELIKIKTNTGDICAENISAGSLDLSVSTGKVTVFGAACEGDIKINVSTGKASITDTKCRNLLSGGSTGDVSLKNVMAAETFSIERSTGDVKFDGCDAAEIFVETDTGDVRGSLLTEKVFITKTDTGSVDVPKTVAGGRCEISTDTGDIKMTIAE